MQKRHHPHLAAAATASASPTSSSGGGGSGFGFCFNDIMELDAGKRRRPQSAGHAHQPEVQAFRHRAEAPLQNQ